LRRVSCFLGVVTYRKIYKSIHLIEYMNEIAIQNSENNKDLDLSSFNPKEQLLVKLVLARKGREGLLTRVTGHGLSSYENVLKENYSGYELARKLHEYLEVDDKFEFARRKIVKFESKVYDEVAQELDISQSRLNEIIDYVYVHEDFW
jgi:hypothetical protein